MAKTADEHLKHMVGDLIVQLAIAHAKIDVLVEELAAAHVTPPPDPPPDPPTP
jgi:hypothetical protein